MDMKNRFKLASQDCISYVVMNYVWMSYVRTAGRFLLPNASLAV